MKISLMTIGIFIMLASCIDEAKAADIGRFNNKVENCTIEDMDGRPIECNDGVGIKANAIIHFKGKDTILHNRITWMNSEATRIEDAGNGNAIYRVIYTPPKDKNILLWLLGNLVDYGVGHPTFLGATREERRICSPEVGATMMYNTPITLSWCGDGNMLILKKEDAIVYESAITGQTLTIPPQYLNEPGNYSWEVRGGKQVARTFVLLNKSDTDEIKKDLQSIESDARWSSEADRLLAKVIYLQRLTEYFSDKWSFNWLACQILAEGNAKISPKERMINSRIVECDLRQCDR